jgi:hypothetical protein
MLSHFYITLLGVSSTLMVIRKMGKMMTGKNRKIIEDRMTGISWCFRMGKVPWLSRSLSQLTLRGMAVMLGKNFMALSSNDCV